MPTSPASKTWERPSGKIKLKLKKKTGSVSLSSVKNLNVLRPLSPNVQQNGRLSSSKRKNPFGCSPRKKRTLETDCDYQAPRNQLFRALDGQREESKEKENEYFEILDTDQNKKNEYEKTTVEDVKGNEENTSKQGQQMFPVDWSLKTKVKFTSTTSFSWSNSLKSFELAEGISGFVRCETENILEENLKITEESSADIYRTLLHKDCKSWIHPSLPWLQLFPRNNQKKHPGKGNFTSMFLDSELSDALHQDWVSSFHSVFNLLRCGRCPYFYLCANHFSMVFIAAGVANNPEIKVLVSPTTKGFRDALTKEGIEFTLPHGQEESSMSGSDSEAGDNECNERVDEKESEDEEDWLQSMGLNKEQFASLESHKNKTQMTKARNTDQHPNSTVVVQGSDTQALYNFILNWRSITPKNGQLAGVPPTLISPVAFEGATLRSHKVNQGIVRHQTTKEMKQLFSLEVTGPLLPGCLHNICQLLRTTQKGEFTATMVQCQPTVAFNIPSASNDECCPVHHSKYGLTPAQAEYLSQSQRELRKNSLKELLCKDGLYTWRTSGSWNQQEKVLSICRNWPARPVKKRLFMERLPNFSKYFIRIVDTI